jgi:hypothetical protein
VAAGARAARPSSRWAASASARRTASARSSGTNYDRVRVAPYDVSQLHQQAAYVDRQAGIARRLWASRGSASAGGCASRGSRRKTRLDFPVGDMAVLIEAVLPLPAAGEARQPQHRAPTLRSFTERP